MSAPAEATAPVGVRPGSFARMVEAIIAGPQPPCVECRLFQRCRRERLACKAFKRYLRKELDSTPYRYAVSIPRRRIYDVIFRACDKCKPMCAECLSSPIRLRAKR